MFVRHAKSDSGFRAELNKCGRHWGMDSEIAVSDVINVIVGKETWIETAVRGVIGIHGNEPGKGPAIIIRDIESAGTEMLWTSGLRGCMCLAIQGRDATGKLDVFFAHARYYDDQHAETDPNNPIKLAREFVCSHSGIRVFWGTDFNFGTRDGNGPARKHEAQIVLSKKLGCWVRMSDCIVYHSLVFFPKLGILKDGSPREAYDWLCLSHAKQGYLSSIAAFSQSMALDRFVADSAILKNLEDHLAEIQADLSSVFRFYLYDARRSNKILALKHVIDAYRVGNFDILRHFGRSATSVVSPFRDEAAVNAWSATSESLTAKYIIEAYQEAKTQILSMNRHGCGLRPDGSDIHSHTEYEAIERTRSGIQIPADSLQAK